MPTSLEPAVDGAFQLIIDRVAVRGEAAVLWDAGREISADTLLNHADTTLQFLTDAGVCSGAIVGFSGDYGLATISTFLAIFKLNAIAVPISTGALAELALLQSEAQIEFWFDINTGDVTRLNGQPTAHPLVLQLRASGHAGLIVFTSGSSGKPKAILHDVERVASKFIAVRPGWRMVMFLLIDHFGGFNTLLACLAYGGVGVCVSSRTPTGVCSAIVDARPNLLPTTPTFLSVLMASGAWRTHDLSSVKLVTYGAEPMPESTLRKLPAIFPRAVFKQTYGLSELGVLHSDSKSSDSLWLRVGGKDFETRVIDGLLHIRSKSSMLGYLNAPTTIDADGWMNTGDMVEQDGDLIKVIGRKSDVINVGGQKVFPVEIEAVLLSSPEVVEATVFAIAHPVLGQVVGARLSLQSDCDEAAAMLKIKANCKAQLQKYKVPMRFELVGVDQHGNERGKKIRR